MTNRGSLAAAAHFTGYRKALTDLIELIRVSAPVGSGPHTRSAALDTVERWAVERREELKKGQHPWRRSKNPLVR